MELGKKIRQLRFKAGLTQENLAERLGLGPQAVSKWETGAAMPDITLLPRLAEIFGVSIDELFDLTAEQRLNCIENSLDIEKTLPQELFREYEDFLKEQLKDEAHRKRATELLAYLYWHRMYSDAGKVRRWAKEAIRRAPGEKNCQYMLQMAEGHAAWDWNVANHHKAVDFYREARFDAPTADRIIEELGREYPDDFVWLFEAAQYYAAKCDYDRAIALYERSFELEPRRPRFQDELMAIADIWEIRGDCRKAAETYDRIVALLEQEWGFTEEVELQAAKAERERLLAKA